MARRRQNSEEALTDRIDVLAEQKAELAELLDQVRNRIAKEYNRHVPKSFDMLAGHGANPLHPGNGLGRVTIWCAGCDQAWPCTDWHRMRNLYKSTYGSEDSTTRYRLVFEKVEENNG